MKEGEDASPPSPTKDTAGGAEGAADSAEAGEGRGGNAEAGPTAQPEADELAKKVPSNSSSPQYNVYSAPCVMIGLWPLNYLTLAFE